MATVGYFGTSQFGLSTYGGIQTAVVRVLKAESLNPFTVRLDFSAPLDPDYTGTLNPANYSINDLTIESLEFSYASPSTLILHTTAQEYQLYDVAVGSARSLSGMLLDSQHNHATFTGFSTQVCFTAVGIGPQRIRLGFERPMLTNASLRNIASYSVQAIDGTYIRVQSVQLEQEADLTSLVLVLESALRTTFWYKVEVSDAVLTTEGLTLTPRTSSFLWVQPEPVARLGLDQFTGEVQGGLFGNPLGLVFFSPALEESQANSIIQIDEVAVCTEASDHYLIPQPIDPFPLYTWKQNAPQTNLGQSGVVLWAAFPRLMEARLDLGDRHQEEFAPVVDGPATATFQEPWDSDYVSLLNNTYWELTPPSAGKALFQTAQNLAPIPPGPVVSIVLQP